MFKSDVISHYNLRDESVTEKLAASFMESLLTMLMVKQHMPIIVFLEGELGAGKTTFVRFCLKKLNYKGNVKSPTYTIVEEYEFSDIPLWIEHFDLYRLKHPEELNELGFREYLKPGRIVFIEWPELGGELVPKPDFRISLYPTQNGESRGCTIERSLL